LQPLLWEQHNPRYALGPNKRVFSAGYERAAKSFTVLVAVKPREVLGIRFPGFDLKIDENRPVFL
jgi:hypothetical protein